MHSIDFLVQGSAPGPYHVTFKKAGSSLTAICTCPAGEVGQYCKHRLRILAGETTGIVSDNHAAVSEVRSWLPGTDVELAILELEKVEQEFEDARKRVSLSKKRLARTLMS